MRRMAQRIEPNHVDSLYTIQTLKRFQHQSNRSIKILEINITYRNRNDIDVEIHNRRSEPSEETPTNQPTNKHERESKY